MGQIEDSSTQEIFISLAQPSHRLYNRKLERPCGSPTHEFRMSISSHTVAQLHGRRGDRSRGGGLPHISHVCIQRIEVSLQHNSSN